MSKVLILDNICDTTLWKYLNSGYNGTSYELIARTLANNLIEICQEASDLMVKFPSLHSQYTLHNKTYYCFEKLCYCS